MTAGRSDVLLLAAIGARDIDAMRELYERHAPWLSIRLARRCNDPEAVADALQDTFLAVWQKPTGFRGEGEVAAWLWAIAIRRLVSRLRSRRDMTVGFEADARLGGRKRHAATECVGGAALVQVC